MVVCSLCLPHSRRSQFVLPYASPSSPPVSLLHSWRAQLASLTFCHRPPPRPCLAAGGPELASLTFCHRPPSLPCLTAGGPERRACRPQVALILASRSAPRTCLPSPRGESDTSWPLSGSDSYDGSAIRHVDVSIHPSFCRYRPRAARRPDQQEPGAHAKLVIDHGPDFKEVQKVPREYPESTQTCAESQIAPAQLVLIWHIAFWESIARLAPDR